MRRTLCFGIALMLMLMTVSYPVSAKGGSMAAAEAAQFFAALDILPAADTAETETVTRADAAEAVVRVMHADAATQETDGYFRDVLTDDPHAAAIYTAARLGVFGKGAETFEPDAALTCAQAIKLAVCMVGYQKKAEAMGGYPSGYIKAAREADILDGTPTDTGTAISYGTWLRLLSKTVHADLLDVAAFGGDYVHFKITPGRTILTEYHHINSYEGVVIADSTMAAEGDVLKEDAVLLDNGEKLVNENPDYVGLVGRYVTAYYKEIGGKNVLLYVRGENNNIITLHAENGSYSYEQNAYYVRSGRGEMALKLDLYADILYNGEATDGIDASIMLPKNGKVTLIDRNEDQRFDTVLIEEYQNAVIDSFDRFTGRIVLKKSPSMTEAERFLTPDADTVIIKNGRRITKDDLKADNVLMVYRTKSGRVWLNVSSKSVSGILSGVDEDGCRIDESSFSVAQNAYVTKEELRIGEYYRYLLNAENEIVDAVAESQQKTGYILAFSKPSGFGKVRARVLTGSGSIAEYPLSDKVTLQDKDGKSRLGASEIASRMENEKRLVSYLENSSGELVQITLPYPITTQEQMVNQPSYPLLRLDYLLLNWPEAEQLSSGEHALGVRYNAYQKDMNNWVIFSDDALIYHVPVPGTTMQDKDMTVEKIERMEDGRSFEVDQTLTPFNQSVEFYSYGGGTAYAEIMVHYSAEENVTTEISADVASGGFGVVSGIEQTVDEEGLSQMTLRVLQYNQSQKDLVLAEDDLMDRAKFGAQQLGGVDSAYADSSVNPQKQNLAVGDVIKYVTNANETKITALALVYDAENETLCYKDSYAKRNHPNGQFVGTVKSRVGSVVTVSDDANYRERLNLNGDVWIFDERDQVFQIGKADDISVGDTMVTFHHNYYYRRSIVYKKEA